MLDRITIKEVGPVPRRLKAAYNQASKDAWMTTGKLFHTTMRDKRFSVAHGKKAGYTPRRGEEPGTDAKTFWRSYTGQKLKKWHHRRPLEWKGMQGGTRSRIGYANISVTSKGAKVAYPGASTFNFRPRGGRINMAAEFRKIIPEEIVTLARNYDTELGTGFRQDRTTTTRQV